jgi:hypothetical protein
MPTDQTINEFGDSLNKLGVDINQYNPSDRLYLYQVAKLCFKQAGLPLGATVGVAMSGVGAVTLPVVGAVPGYVAGFLAGAFGGTAACVMGRMSFKRDLDQLLQDSPQSVRGRVINDL